MSDQHENVTSPEEGRARARLTATLMFVLGALVILPVESVAWLLVSVVLDFPEGTDSEVLFISLWLVIVVVPLVLLWVSGGRRRRWFATGAAASMVLLLAYFGVTANASLRDPDAGQRLAEVAAGSQVPIYSVGPKFHGWTLDDVGIDHGDDQGLDVSDTSLDPGETLFLGYGTTCTASTNGSCGDRFELDLHAVSSADLEHRCVHRLPTTRGITPVELEDYGVVIFVGPMAVRFADQPPDSLVTDTAAALRRVGAGSTTEALPAPSYQVTQLIQHCLVRPRG